MVLAVKNRKLFDFYQTILDEEVYRAQRLRPGGNPKPHANHHQPVQPAQKTLTVGQTSASTITQGTMVQDISTHSEL
jgi:hypothetical protein